MQAKHTNEKDSSAAGINLVGYEEFFIKLSLLIVISRQHTRWVFLMVNHIHRYYKTLLVGYEREYIFYTNPKTHVHETNNNLADVFGAKSWTKSPNSNGNWVSWYIIFFCFKSLGIYRIYHVSCVFCYCPYLWTLIIRHILRWAHVFHKSYKMKRLETTINYYHRKSWTTSLQQIMLIF